MQDKSFSSSINEIAKRYDMEFMVYFGSYKTEYYNRDSDIDIAYLSVEQLDADKHIKFFEDLVLLHRKTELDLVDLRISEPLLKFEIAKTGKVLYEKEKGLFERYSMYYIKKIYELKPNIEDELRKLSNSINEVLSNER